MATRSRERCLAGVHVLEFSEGWSAGAVTGRLLADLGATVTKVERLGGDGLRQLRPDAGTGSTLFASLHREKQMLDPVEPASLGATLGGRHDGVDVVVVDAWWTARLAMPLELDVPVLAFVTPRGASEEPRGSELVSQALGAIPSITGHRGSDPTRAGIPMSASATGLVAAGAVEAALLRTRRTGQPARLDIAEFDVMVMMQGNFLPGFLTSGETPGRVGNVQLLSAPWNCYPTRDGDVVIIAISEKLWERLLNVVGRTDLIGDPRYQGKARRVARREEIDGFITEWTSARSSEEAVGVLLEAGVPVSHVARIGDVMNDPFTRERELVLEEAGSRIMGTTLKVHALDPSEEGIDAIPPASRGRASPQRSDASQPLAGIRVLEVGGHTAGGMSTRLLADLGADVIKVEMPQGDNARYTVPILSDGAAHLWHFWNVGKRSIVLDFSQAAGHAALMSLVETSDVFLENMAPDTAENLRILPEHLRPHNPRLVHCSLSAFGAFSSRRERRGFDAVLQAAGGIMSVTGDEDGGPVKTGPSVVDNLTALTSTVAILGALLRRERTGSGAFVDLALYDVAVWLTAEWWPLAGDATRARPMGNRHPYHELDDLYRAADGGWVAVGAGDALDGRAVAMSLAGGDDPSTWRASLASWIGGRSVTEAVAGLRAKGLAAGPLLDIPDLVEHELTWRREMLEPIEIEGQDRECVVVGSPYRLLDEPTWRAGRRHVPGLGEHTRQVLLGDLAMDLRRVEALAEAGITLPRRRE